MINGHKTPQSLKEELEANAQVNAAARFWMLAQAQELAENPGLKTGLGSTTMADERRRIALINLVGRRVVRLMFGVLLREVSARPGVFTAAVAALANGMALEIGENLQAFSFDERLRALTGLTQQLAAGMQIGLAAADDEAEG
jgi:hypothetical protein